MTEDEWKAMLGPLPALVGELIARVEELDQKTRAMDAVFWALFSDVSDTVKVELKARLEAVTKGYVPLFTAQNQGLDLSENMTAVAQSYLLLLNDTDTSKDEQPPS